MFTLKVENKKGEILDLTSEYIIEKIDGLAPPSAAINTSTVGTNDGTIYNSARVENRNIVITARIKEPVEANRIRLYRFFKIKDWCRLYFKNGTRTFILTGIRKIYHVIFLRMVGKRPKFPCCAIIHFSKT